MCVSCLESRRSNQCLPGRPCFALKCYRKMTRCEVCRIGWTITWLLESPIFGCWIRRNVEPRSAGLIVGIDTIEQNVGLVAARAVDRATSCVRILVNVGVISQI